MRLWDCTTENGQKALRQIYESLTGEKFRAPPRKKNDIEYDNKLEPMPRTNKLTREKPPNTIAKEGKKR